MKRDPAPISDYPCKHCHNEVYLLAAAGVPLQASVKLSRDDETEEERARRPADLELELQPADIWKCSVCPWQGTTEELAEPLPSAKNARGEDVEDLSFRAFERLMKKDIKPTGGGNRSGKREEKPGDKIRGNPDTARMREWEKKVRNADPKTEVIRVAGVRATSDELAAAAALVAMDLLASEKDAILRGLRRGDLSPDGCLGADPPS